MSQQINLYTPLFRKRGFSFTSASAMLYGIGIAFAAAAFAAAYQDYRSREVAQQAHAGESALKEVQARRDKLLAEHAARRPDVQLGAEIAALNAQLQGRQEVMDALNSGVIGTDEGFSEYLRAFSRPSVSGLWLTVIDIAGGGSDLSISGRALSAELVPSYLQRLNQEKPMQGRQFAALRIHRAAAAGPEPAQAADPGAKDGKDGKARPTLPRYLEFTISTRELGAGADKQSVGQTPQSLSLQEADARAAR